jgi:hypothetical protein
MIARLHIKEGEYREAMPILTALLQDQGIDLSYEQLFLARTYEALAACADGLDKPAERDSWLYQLYRIYPQLIPFSGMKMPMQLQVAGSADDAVIRRLRACNISFDEGAVPNVRALLNFTTRGKLRVVEYSVIDGTGNFIVPKQAYSYSDANVAGLSLAYRLFGIGGMAQIDGPEDKEAI